MRTLASLVAGIWMVLYGVGALAEGTKTNTLLEKASAKYAELDFEAALPYLEQAIQQPGNSHFQMVRIYHLWGLCLGSLGKSDQAREYFARALSLDPSFRLGSDVSPRISSPFKELLKSNPPRLDVQVLPPPYVEQGKPLVFNARVVSDPLKLARSVRLWFKRENGKAYSSVFISLGGVGQFPITVSPTLWQTSGSAGSIFWFAVLENEHQGHLSDIGDETRPLSLEVMDKPVSAGSAIASQQASPWYSKWWIWTIVGGVAIAGATTAVILTTNKPASAFDFTVDFR